MFRANFLFLLGCITALSVPAHVNGRGANGGFTCAGCTFTLTVLGQVSQIHNTSIADVIGQVCKFLPPGVYQGACYGVIKVYGPLAIKLLNKKAPPDVACHAMGLCYTEKGNQMCHIAPRSQVKLKKEKWLADQVAKGYFQSLKVNAFDICTIPGVRAVCDIIKRVSENNLPGVDLDGDGFSTIKTLRGALWRGRDCDDFLQHIHPGAKPELWDVLVDTNCNGIYGADKETGRPYEDLYCGGSGQMGVAALGDSVTAHFHIPHQWVNSSEFANEKLLSFLPFVIENEFDWPMLSAATGYMENQWPVIQGPVDSIYLRLRRRNRCNHRDFQNLGVNGADSTDMQHIQNSLSRNNKTDVPLLVFYAMVGNDVCNWHSKDTVAHMTTPAQMRTNLINTLNFLDSRLPANSHVIVVGLADGRVLYNNLHDRVHPLGNLHHDIRYRDLYDFLNCLQISPCAGWMGSNETIRNQTSERAFQLSQVEEEVTKTHKFKNFDVHFMPNPLKAVLDEWILVHGKENVYKLIDAVDGFHPNQYAQAQVAGQMWRFLEKNAPHVLGDFNPYNMDIERRFGDQGGY